MDLFTKSYKKLYKDVYRLIYSSILNIQDTEDLLQRTFIKLYQNIDKFDKYDDYIKKWLFRVAINEIKDFRSSSWNKRKVDIENFESIIGNKSDSSHNDLFNIMININSDYRTPIYLYYYEGYSIKEIAEIMKLSETCIKTRLKRGKEKMKKEMEKE